MDAAAIKFVRHQKTTMLELQRRAAEKAQQIIQKQASAACSRTSETAASPSAGVGSVDLWLWHCLCSLPC